MKKLTALLLAFLLMLSFVGCSETYVPNDSVSSGSVSGSDVGSGGSSSDGPSQDPENAPFTVTVSTSDGSELPSMSDISAIWTSKSNVYTSKLSDSGVATSNEPDGEYRVTLSQTPDGFTYDPNVYYVDNENKNVNIVLYPIRDMSGSGGMTDQSCYRLPVVGTYRFTFNAPEELAYFTFSPIREGTYQFSSLMDATANEVNVTIYKHSVQFLHPIEMTVEDPTPGKTNSFTKNFKSTLDVPDDELGGARYFSLQIHSTARDIFPVSVDIMLERLGSYERPNLWQDAEVPEIKTDFTIPSGRFNLIADTNGKVLDRNMVGYMEDGTFKGYIDADGYYRVNVDGKGVEGPILFAKLSGALPYLADGLSYPLVRHTCGNVMKDYTAFYSAHLSKAINGYIPVTEALAEYLYNFSVSNQYFWDGNGTAEGYGYNSNEASQWLFACGYFK